jgi:transposase
VAEVAGRFSVSQSFVEKLMRRLREEGVLAPRPHGGGRKPLLAGHGEALRSHLRGQPDTTLAELREVLGLQAQISTLWYRLRRLWG